MAASVFVSHEQPLNVSAGPAQLRLANLAQDGWLNAASQVAYQRGVDHLMRAGPFGDVPGLSRLVWVQFVNPVYGDGAMTLGLRWEAIGYDRGLFPVLDANIRLSGTTGQRGQLALTASYRPPLGAMGAGLDRLLLHTVATATIRAFASRLASALEGTPQPAQQTAAPAWQEPGPAPASTAATAWRSGLRPGLHEVSGWAAGGGLGGAGGA